MRPLCLDGDFNFSKKQRKKNHNGISITTRPCVLESGNNSEMQCHVESIMRFRDSSFQDEELTKYLASFLSERDEQLSHLSCFDLCSRSKFSREQLEKIPTKRRQWLSLLQHALKKPTRMLAGTSSTQP